MLLIKTTIKPLVSHSEVILRRLRYGVALRLFENTNRLSNYKFMRVK